MKPASTLCHSVRGSGSRLGRAGALLWAVALAGCGSAGSPPGSSPTTSPTIPPTPTSAGSASPGPAQSASPAADGWARLLWTAVTPTTAVRPRGGFEHNFLASDRGAMIMIRNLEGPATTLVATTPDGADWAVTEVDATTIPLGYSVDGADDFLQVVARADGEPGLELVASGDGSTWETRGRLPDTMESAGESAVNASSLLVCGFGRGAIENQTVCGLSRDGGTTWESVSDLESLAGSAGIRGLVALGGGFLALVQGEREGESVVLTSPDGSSWTRQPSLLASDGFEVTDFGSSVYATGNDGIVWVTDDGASWREVALPTMQGPVSSFVKAGNSLVAVGTVTEPEGNANLTDLVVSTDGATWRADVVPAALRNQNTDPTIMPVMDGMLVVGDPTMMVGRPIPADDPGPP